jgi:hypothetical protein
MEKVPYTERALKDTDKFPILKRMDVPSFVAFYNKCVGVFARYFIQILPFEAVSPTLKGGHGFCPPGLGYSRYVKMGHALLLVLEQLLESQPGVIRSHIRFLQARGQGNGYVLLWQICCHSLPLYDPTKELPNPRWPETNDIYEFATLVRVHRSAMVLRGTNMTEFAMCSLFLRNVKHPLYREQALSLQRAMREATSDGERPLPLKFDLDMLVYTLYDTCGAPDEEVDLGRHVTFGTKVSHLGFGGGHAHIRDGESVDGEVHIQGFVANRTLRDRKSDGDRGSRDRRRPGGARRPKFDGNCAACGRYGHPATTCTMLAIMVHLKQAQLPKEIVEQALAHWAERNKKWLDKEDSKPESPRDMRKRGEKYIRKCGVSLEQIAREMDWSATDAGGILDSSLEDDTSEDESLE